MLAAAAGAFAILFETLGYASLVFTIFPIALAIFPDMITVTEKIERYVQENHGGRLDGAIGSSSGSSLAGALHRIDMSWA